MKDYAAKENYFSEEGIAESTKSLMQKLEAAGGANPNRRRIRRRGAGQSHAERLGTAHLLVTLLAILIGTFVGVVLSTYLV